MQTTVATGEARCRPISTSFFSLSSLNPNSWKLLVKSATTASPVSYPDERSWLEGSCPVPRSLQTGRPGEAVSWWVSAGVVATLLKLVFKNMLVRVSAAEAVLTLLVKFPCTRPSTKSCDLKALTNDERDSMERPFISVWYLSIMDHRPCSKIRRRTSLQCKEETKPQAAKSSLM